MSILFNLHLFDIYIFTFISLCLLFFLLLPSVPVFDHLFIAGDEFYPILQSLLFVKECVSFAMCNHKDFNQAKEVWIAKFVSFSTVQSYHDRLLDNPLQTMVKKNHSEDKLRKVVFDKNALIPEHVKDLIQIVVRVHDGAEGFARVEVFPPNLRYRLD